MKGVGDAGTLRERCGRTWGSGRRRAPPWQPGFCEPRTADIGVRLQAGATSAVETIKMSARLAVGGPDPVPEGA